MSSLVWFISGKCPFCDKYMVSLINQAAMIQCPWHKLIQPMIICDVHLNL